MKSAKNRRLMGLALVLLFISASCSTPAYKQNKYKSAKRSRDCGCLYQKHNTDTMLCFDDKR